MQIPLFSDEYDHLLIVQTTGTLNDTSGLNSKPTIYTIVTEESTTTPASTPGSSSFSLFFPLKLDAALPGPTNTVPTNIPMILAKLGIQPDSGWELLRGAEIDSIRLYTALRPTATATVPVPVTGFATMTTPANSAAAEALDGPYLISISLTPNPSSAEAETDFHAWYDEEHINLLSRVPGWQACRRFELVDIQSVNANLDSPKPPRFLALHRWRDLNGSSTPQFKAATNTPWRTRVMEGVVARERSVWRLVERPY